MHRLSFLAAALVVAVAGSAAAQSSSLAVTDVWARATPPGAKAAAAYATITNNGGADDQLVGASTPAAGKAQVHTTTTNASGVMQMRPVPALDVKPGATVTLKPGGFHIMLTELKHPLKEGDSFPLTLRFAKAGQVETTVKVAKIGAASAMGDMKDMPGMNMK